MSAQQGAIAMVDGARYQRRSQPLMNDLSDTETVMLDIERGTYFGLRDVAKAIWDLLEQPRTTDEVCHELVSRFEVDRQTCEVEVAAFLEQLRTAELIHVHHDR